MAIVAPGGLAAGGGSEVAAGQPLRCGGWGGTEGRPPARWTRICGCMHRQIPAVEVPTGITVEATSEQLKRGAVMLLIILLLGGALAAAQQDHSRHQHAVAGLGTVDFPTSCNASAQKWISRGVALLHSFGYEEARLAFNEAANADPSCGMAHWGVARTWYHPIWAPPSPDELKQGTEAIKRALTTGAKTERERAYMNALAFFYRGLADG